MAHPRFAFTPEFDQAAILRALGRLFIPGPVVDNDLAGKISRLEERFRVYATSIPFGLWAPGLNVTDEMRVLTDVYLPPSEIRRAFARLSRLSLTFSPSAGNSFPWSTGCWLDIVSLLPSGIAAASPAQVLRRLMADEEARQSLFFALSLPKNHGGGFDRYPVQAAFLTSWLEASAKRFAAGVRCLDAACGSGEGTYELAQILLSRNLTRNSLVEGSSLEPLELFAAAHGYFPNDLERQESYRRRVSPFGNFAGQPLVSFYLEDLTGGPGTDCYYDVILCNGLLGGPMLHDREKLEAVVRRLAGRLAPGGVLLAADRFHGGWKKAVPKELLEAMMQRSGLGVLPVDEGVVGVFEL